MQLLVQDGSCHVQCSGSSKKQSKLSWKSQFSRESDCMSSMHSDGRSVRMNIRMLDGILTTRVKMLLNLGILYHSIIENLVNWKAMSKPIKLDIIILWLVHCATCSFMDL